MGTHGRAYILAQQPRLIELYRAGAPVAEIARELGLTCNGVGLRLARLVWDGVLERRAPIKRGPYQRPEGQAEQAVELYALGATWAQAGEALGVTGETFGARLREQRIPRRRRTPRWEAAQHWPWPLSLADVAQRLYGAQGAAERRHARILVTGWLASGKLVRAGWARYDRP